MAVSFQTYLRDANRAARKWVLSPGLGALARVLGFGAAGFTAGAAGLAGYPMPVAMALLLAVPPGWGTLLLALTGSGSYMLLWGQAGLQGLAWMGMALLCSALLGGRKILEDSPLLLPALGALIAAAGGVAMQLLADDLTPIPIFLLRVGMGAGCTWVFSQAAERRDAAMDWLVCALGVLGLAQIAPSVWLNLGCAAAAAVTAAGPFPAAALAGLALDLGQVCPVPMTAVMCAAYLIRLLPGQARWPGRLAPALMYPAVMALCGSFDLHPLPALLIGGIASALIPDSAPIARRRGSTGVLQVKLELAAGAMSQAEQLLLETEEGMIDEQALISRAIQRSCGSCPCRKGCRERETAAAIAPAVLHRALFAPEDLPVSCRKSGRLLQELRRSQEQLRAIRADRQRRREYREALTQQYRFLGDYLRLLADELARHDEDRRARFTPRIEVATAGREQANGDKCLCFAGTCCRYYVLLCDGMGTGLGAAEESRRAGDMLRRLLSAGYPAQYALRGMNSLCALRDRGGAVTVDLAEIRLDSGYVTLYKWGAAASYFLSRGTAEKIGTAGPPPGLSVTEGRETTERLSLRRGETLLLCSDGVDGEDVRRRLKEAPDQPPGEMAAKILECGKGQREDDATVAVIRLVSSAVSA